MGQMAGFQCGTMGTSPPFEITWWKDSVLVDVASDSRLHFTTETGSLFIRDVVSSDAGHYNCLVSNAVGTLPSMMALLSVVDAASLGMVSSHDFMDYHVTTIEVVCINYVITKSTHLHS